VSLSVRFRQTFCALLGVVFLGVCQNAHASFSLTFQGLVQTLPTTGAGALSFPAGIVVDSTGDVFIADTGNNRIVGVNAQGAASALPISGIGALSSPSGLALDGAGNLYIADTGNNRIVKATSSGAGTVISTGSVTLNSPGGIALDQSGDLFIADTGNNRIAGVTSGGSAAVLAITVSSGITTLSSPKGLTVNNSGQLYIADSGHNRIVSVAAGSTTGVVVSILGGVTLNNPTAVFTDSIGNVYAADTGNSRIAEIDSSSNGTVLYTGSVTLNGPKAMAVNPFGTVYVADSGDNQVLVVDPPVNGDLTASDPTYSLNQSLVGFGHVQLGSSTPVTLTLLFTTGNVGLGAAKVLTSGVQNLDFTSGSGTTCNSTTPASALCYVQISFLPTAPGLRAGAVVLYDTSLHPILTIPLYGFADSPVEALAPDIGSVVNTGSLVLNDPFQVALDGAGNLYVGVYSTTNVTRIPAGGGSASLVSLGTPGGIAPQSITGVALDGAGNLFIGDHINSRILVVTPGGVVSVLTINQLSPAIELPTELAFDSAGNLYIADYGNGRVVKVSSLVVSGSTSSGLGTALGTGSYSFGISTLSGVAVDLRGTVYLAARTENNSSIIELTASGVASTLPIPGATPSGPQGVAVDPMGNIYVVDAGNRRIVKVASTGAASVFSISGLTNPSTLSSSLFGVTVDPLGNLYISDWTNNRIVFVNVSGSALTFPSTANGATSVAQTATVTNLGNEPLDLSANPTYTANFSENAADTNPCTSTTALLSGISCDVSVQFTPQSVGSLSAGITVTNNTLNVAGSTQQVSVSGTSFSSGDTTSTTLTTSPISVAVGQAATLTAVVRDTITPANIPAGGVSFTDTVGTTVVSLNGGARVPLAGGTATLQVTPAVVGVHTITANFVGSTPGVGPAPYASSSATATLTVTAIVPTLSFAPIAAQTNGNPPFAVSATSASSGAVTYTVVSGPATIAGNMVTATGAGTVTLSASQAASGNYAAATATISFTVAAAPGAPVPTLSFAPIAAQTFGNPPFAVSASSPSSGAVTYAIVSGPATIAGNIVTLTGAGTVTLTASQAASGQYAAATGTVSFIVAAPMGFTLTSTAGSAVESVLPGGAAAFNLTLSPGSGLTYPDPLTLSATGLPAGATAAFSPATIPAGSGATAVTMTVQTVKQPTAQGAMPVPGGPPGAMALALLLLPLAGIKPLRRRLSKLPGLPVALAAAGLSLGVVACLSGCGSNGFFNQARAQYTVVVTATDTVTGAHSSTNVTLTVQ
jgi:DNA-binding beta-propeller fold protein YncE